MYSVASAPYMYAANVNRMPHTVLYSMNIDYVTPSMISPWQLLLIGSAYSL